jgi:hypothetical protein
VAGYSYITLAQARAQLADRLNDPNLVHFGEGSVAELNFYIVEALRNWQALCGGFYKQRIALTIGPTAPPDNGVYYDLTAAAPTGAFDYNELSTQLVSQLCYHLLEPQFSSTVAIGIQYSLAELVTAIQNRINRFLGDTGCVISRVLQSTSSELTFLPDTVTDVRRAAWINSGNVTTTLWKSDEFGFNAFLPSRLAVPADPPLAYARYTPPPVSIELAPSPANGGTLDLLTINSGPVFSTVPATFYSQALPLAIPDDLSWAVKWGVLSDLLSIDGQQTDPIRAAYCEQRYQEAVALASIYPSVMIAQIGNTVLPVGSVFDMDAYTASWQSATPGPPTYIGLAGRNLLAVSPPPDQTYTITMDLVSNIPAPVADSDLIQVGRDALDVILDYAEHLALFKDSGAEFSASQKLYVNMVQNAMVQNNRLQKLAIFRNALIQPSQRQLQEVERV